MKTRDFTDEHKRSSIPTMKSGEDPGSPFCTDLNLISRGAVAQMRLPPGWIFGDKENSGARRYSYQNLHPADNPNAMISFFYRGNLISQSSATNLRQLIAEAGRQLSGAEVNSIAEILQDRADPTYFDLGLAKSKTLNKKIILVIEGYFRHIPEGRLQLFIPADESGFVIQEIFYQAPISEYTQYRQAACNAFDSIVWK